MRSAYIITRACRSGVCVFYFYFNFNFFRREVKGKGRKKGEGKGESYISMNVWSPTLSGHFVCVVEQTPVESIPGVGIRVSISVWYKGIIICGTRISMGINMYKLMLSVCFDNSF